MKATRAIALASVTVIALAACGSDSDSEAPTDTTAVADTDATDTGSATTDGESATTDGEAATTDGEAVCPSELVIQTDWFPELEHGGTYQLIGPDGVADKDTVSYSGPVQEQYAVGGLETITIRTVNFDKSNASVLADGDADMAYLTTSDIIKDSAAIPLVAIAKTLDQDPQMVQWDPAQYDITEPADIAATGAQVLHFPGTSYIDYMIAEGFITADQSNPSYDGSDGAWVADGGNFFQQGFATNEIYKYENDVAWKDGGPADVSFFTVGDLGFENYPAAITMLQSRADELDSCLTELVPMMQQAWIDFLDDPKPITDAMISINETHDGFWSLSEGLNEAGLALVESDGYAVNSDDGTYCSFDPDRMQTLYDILQPIYAEQGTEVADSVEGVYTNKYCEGAPGR
ncbi:MAG: hypothetical protein ABJH68_17845 [Ilumatobacter sp.]|uniref:hypothetical protein n=1 Tax=Ilumatobacter sp. TaxID=1967498 RepID=UPI00329864D9